MELLQRAVIASWRGVFWHLERQYERLLREQPERYLREIFTNPVIMAQANDELVFSPDWELGHTLPPGKDFIGEHHFESLAAVAERVRTEQKRLIVNVGDSSTSGWDSYVTNENRQRRAEGRSDVVLPFFRYRTYSDMLRTALEGRPGERFEVVNAGVPAHSSEQGYRALRRLLRAMARLNCRPEVVTLYFGNNDSAWNGGLADEDLLPADEELGTSLRGAIFNGSTFGKVVLARWTRRRALRRIRNAGLCPRVPPLQYKARMRAMVRLCLSYGVRPILIEPPVPLYWRPGQRVRHEDLPIGHLRESPAGSLMLERLEHARRLWELAQEELLKSGESNRVETLLERARESDLLLPRIKASHRRHLRAVALEERCQLVGIALPPGDDAAHFLDYCHPIERANSLLAEAIAEAALSPHAVTAWAKASPPRRYGWYSRLGAVASRGAARSTDTASGIPSEIYTLH